MHEDLETIALKCLEKDPKRRYGSADEVANELQRFIQGEPIRARPVSQVEHAWRWGQRHPAIAGMAAALVVVATLGLVGILLMWRSAALERDVARWQSYRANIGVAISGLELHQADTVRTALDAAPSEHRNWEWHYSRNQVREPTRVLVPESGNESNEFVFAPGNKLMQQMWMPPVYPGYGPLVTHVWDLDTGEERRVNGVVSRDLRYDAALGEDGRNPHCRP